MSTQLFAVDEEESSSFPTASSRTYGSASAFTTGTHSIALIPENYNENDPVSKFTNIGLEVTSAAIGSFVTHPCIVFRRQCQVNQRALSYHLTPFSLIPVILRMQQRQGIICMWKGCSGIFILRGLSSALETFLAELTSLPREVSSNSSIKQTCQHLLLKFLSFGLLTPFYCANFVETVQSDIASEKPGLLDFFREGVCRLLKIGTPHTTRLLPIWQLAPPTAALRLSHYVIANAVQKISQWAKSSSPHPDSKEEHSTVYLYLDELSSAILGIFIANVLLFPAETILHRLYLQGTRTIIDSLDSGGGVLPVLSGYEGPADCFRTVLREEGAAGLYRGFGALVLEFALQAAIVKALQAVCARA